jgi:hypothetical protein
MPKKTVGFLVGSKLRECVQKAKTADKIQRDRPSPIQDRVTPTTNDDQTTTFDQNMAVWVRDDNRASILELY